MTPPPIGVFFFWSAISNTYCAELWVIKSWSQKSAPQADSQTLWKPAQGLLQGPCGQDELWVWKAFGKVCDPAIVVKSRLLDSPWKRSVVRWMIMSWCMTCLHSCFKYVLIDFWRGAWRRCKHYLDELASCQDKKLVVNISLFLSETTYYIEMSTNCVISHSQYMFIT